MLNDVTILYFEAENEDELRTVGHSKERRADPQIVVGLLADRNGISLEIVCFEGGPPKARGAPMAETKAIGPIIQQFQARHGIKDMVVVAGAGCFRPRTLPRWMRRAYDSSSAPVR